MAVSRPSRWKAIELDGRHPLAVHIITVQGTCQKGGYRELTSIQAYREREMEGPQRFRVERPEYFVRRGVRKSDGTRYRPLAGIPIYFHKTVFDFYAAVGYNYKAKKYV